MNAVTKPWTFEPYTLPMLIPSAANLREHWAQRAKRVANQRGTLKLVMRPLFRSQGVRLPLTVRLTRIAPRLLDGDNLQGALKAIRDGVADALEVDDRDARVRWSYNQERGEPKQHALRIEVEPWQ